MSVSDSDDSGSLQSMLHVRLASMYPKKVLKETQETASIPLPFSPICGEAVEHIGRITDGVLALSNYRIYYQRTGSDGKGDFNIPLGLIESVEVKDMFHIFINCKDVRTYQCSFPTNDVCVDWMRKISKAIAPKSVEELFAFVYYAWATDEGEEISSYLGRETTTYRDYFRAEYERMKFDCDGGGKWRVSSINIDYKLCPSYPRHLIVPAKFSDQELESSAKFRSSQRIPAVVWRNEKNGLVIARSSQPEVGWFGWRSNDDESLLKKIADACATPANPKPKLLVMDARSYTSAVANRARGGGVECLEYYPNSEILFMNLANIHCVRKSFFMLRTLCSAQPDENSWHTQLDNTKWLTHISLLIQTANRVVTALDKDNKPVLVHCSDGWDRTSQIVSLAELFLDPYYRTIEGFQVLCEREWLDFGHKFADRCGTGEDPHEKCPVFLQWLDCIHNVLDQYPCAFEFSKRFLIKLAEHTYSNLFGTFLCNTGFERRDKAIPQRTFSVWRYLNGPQFRNYLYDKNCDKVLYPKCSVRDLDLWKDLYIDTAYLESPDVSVQLTNDSQAVESADDKNVPLQETENGSLNNLGNNLGSMLESAINCQPDTIVGSESSCGGGEHVSDCEAQSCTAVVDDHKEMVEKSTPGDHNLLQIIDERDDDDDDDGDRLSGVVGVANALELSNLISSNLNSETGDNVKVADSPCRVPCDADVDRGSVDTGEDAATAVRLLQIGDQPKSCVKDASTTKEKDCDILSSRERNESSEGCGGGGGSSCGDDVEEELVMRLSGGDASVQTSVETIVANHSDEVFVANDLCEYKTVTNGLKNCDLSSCANGRQQLTSLLLDPIDGLPLIPDDVQDRLQQISIEHKAQMAALSSELHTTRYALMNKICNQCVHQNINPPEKQIISDDDKGSVCSTEISWEAVDEKDVGQVLWVPDYAVNFCTSCNSRFWLGRRKHHCRGCGKIFCADCSRNVTTLPNEQLFDPVRVCEECYQTKRVAPSCLAYATSPKQTTCKQAAAGEEQQNSSMMLPPTPPI